MRRRAAARQSECLKCVSEAESSRLPSLAPSLEELFSEWLAAEVVVGGGHAVCSYLDHAAVDGQSGADHVHVGRGGGALPLGQAAGRGRA